MNIDPPLLVAIGDVLLNLSAGWFGAAAFIPTTYPRQREVNLGYVVANILVGVVTLVIGYKFRILGA